MEVQSDAFYKCNFRGKSRMARKVRVEEGGESVEIRDISGPTGLQYRYEAIDVVFSGEGGGDPRLAHF